MREGIFTLKKSGQEMKNMFDILSNILSTPQFFFSKDIISRMKSYRQMCTEMCIKGIKIVMLFCYRRNTCTFKKKLRGLPWWSSGQDFMLPV